MMEQWPRLQAGKKKPKRRFKDFAATSYSEEDDSECDESGGGEAGGRRHATSCLIIPLLTVDSSRGSSNHHVATDHTDVGRAEGAHSNSLTPDGTGPASRRSSSAR